MFRTLSDSPPDIYNSQRNSATMAEAQQHPEIRADDIVDDQNMEVRHSLPLLISYLTREKTVETQMMESAVASSLSCSFREAYLEWTEDSTGEWKAKMGLPSVSTRISIGIFWTDQYDRTPKNWMSAGPRSKICKKHTRSRRPFPNYLSQISCQTEKRQSS